MTTSRSVRLLALALVILLVGAFAVVARGSAKPGLAAGDARAASTVRLYPLADAWVDLQFPATNHGGDSRLIVGYNNCVEPEFPNKGRALLQFDLSLIPPGQIIKSAYLEAYVTGYVTCQNLIINMYRLLGPWNEGTVTYNSQPGISGLYWGQNLGCWINAHAQWNATQLVRDWYQGTYSNYGVILISSEESACKQRTFDSREGSNDPYLEIEYEAPTPTPTATPTNTPIPQPSNTPTRTMSPTPQPAPVAIITSPPDGASVIYTFSIYGSAIGYPLQEWWLEFAPGTWPSAPGPWTPLTYEHLNYINQELGSLSTNSLADGPYAIRLRVIQVGGATSIAGITVYVHHGTATSTHTATRTVRPSTTPTATAGEVRPTRTSTPELRPTQTPTPTPVEMTVCAVADAYVAQASPGQNYGTSGFVDVRWGQGPSEPFARRALVRFDLSFIPPGTHIESATLGMGMYDSNGLSPVTLSAYPIRSDWSETGVTWGTQPLYASTAAASALADLGVPQLINWDLTELVARWLTGDARNYGVMIRGPETGLFWGRTFESRDGTFCPQLTINMSPPGPVPTVTPSAAPTATPTSTPVCPSPDAAGNTPSLATPLTLFTDRQEYICPSGDEDWWKFQANYLNEIVVTLTGLPADYDLTLVNPDGGGAAWSNTSGLANEFIRFYADRSGQWKAGVYGTGPAQWNKNTPCTLHVDVCGGPDNHLEPGAGDSFGWPATLPLGVTHYGWLCPKGDQDWYQIDVPPGDPVTLTASLTNLPDYYYMELRRPDGALYDVSPEIYMLDKHLTSVIHDRPGPWRLVVRPLTNADPEWDATQAYHLLVNVPPPPDLTITKMETVQVTQDVNQSIHLVANKSTMVRVFVDVGNVNSAIPHATVKLTGLRGSTVLPGSPLSVTRTATKTTLAQQRLDLTRSFNFVIPASWTTSGAVTFSAVVNPDHTVTETNYSNNTRSLVDKFNNAGEVNIWFVRVSVNGLAPTGNEAVIDDMYWYLRDIYPTASVGWWESAGYVLTANYNFANWSLQNCGPAWGSLLDDLQELYDDWDNRPPNAIVYGLIHTSVNTGPIGGCGRTGGGVSAGKVNAGNTTTPAHEVGHNFGLPHAPCGGPASTDPNWPTGTNPNATIGEVGIRPTQGNGGTLFAPTTNFDLMSYCGPAWISPYNYKKLLSSLSPGATALSDESEAPEFAESTPGDASAAEVPHLIVRGTVVDGELELPRPFWTRDYAEGTHDQPGEGEYSVGLYGGSGEPLFVRRFDPAPDLGVGQNAGSFHEIMPYPPGVRRIIFRRGETIVRQVAVSPHAPEVTVLSPNGGEVWSGGGPFVVEWQATDEDGNDLSASVLYSPDGGATWQTLAVNLSSNAHELNASSLPGSANALIRVRVTDGVNTTTDDSDEAFRVTRKAPVVRIQGPANGARALPQDQLALQGIATDPEDGQVPGERMRWTSDLDGALGTGTTVVISDLSPGTHVITLTAIDSDGEQDSASVTVFVGLPTFMPLLGVGE